MKNGSRSPNCLFFRFLRWSDPVFGSQCVKKGGVLGYNVSYQWSDLSAVQPDAEAIV
jgi:hypothetical protein